MSLAGNIRVGVGPSAKNFWNQFRAQTRTNQPTLKVPVNPSLTQLRAEIAAERKRQEANAINLRVAVDKRGMRDVQALSREVNHIYKVSAGRKAIRIQIAVLGASALPAAAQGILSLTTAVTQLSRALLVLPGAFSGVVAAAGTLAVGMGGVGDALKAAGEGLKNNRQHARDYERATRDLERAQRNVVQALKDANREIEDQSDKLRSGQLSIEQAQINVQRANERLAQGGFQSMSEWRQAVLDVKRANFDLGQTLKENKRDIQDYYDNTVKSATETETFRSAVDQLSNSLDDYTKAQLQAAGMSERFIEAMDNLSPKAQLFVRDLLALKDSWGDLKNTVQDNLFDGLGASITDLSNSRLPMLKQRMGEIATSLNSNFKQIFATLGSDENSAGISSIMDRMAKALAIANPGLDAFVSGFIKLSEVGSRFLPRFAEAFNVLGARFDSFIDRAEADGSLVRWMNSGIEAVNSLANALGSVFSIFGSVTRAYETATGNLGGFAATLERNLGRLADFLSSPAGQLKMREYIKYAQSFIEILKDTMPGILNLFQAISDGLRAFGAIILPIISAIGNWAAGHGAIVRQIVMAYAMFRTVKPFVTFITRFWKKASEGAKAYKAQMASSKMALAELQKEHVALGAVQRKQEMERFKAIRERSLAVGRLRDVEAETDWRRQEAATNVRLAEEKLAKRRVALNKAVANSAAVSANTAGKSAEEMAEAQEKAWNRVQKAQRGVIIADEQLYKSRQNFTQVNAQSANNEARARQRVAKAQGEVIVMGQKLTDVQRLNVDMSNRLTEATKKQESSFGKLRTAIGSRGRGGIVGALGGLMTMVGGVVSGIMGLAGTVGLMFALDKLAEAHQKAADRADYHLDRLNALKNALDPATGAVTAEGTAMALEMAQATELTGSGNKTLTVNALTEGQNLGITPQQLGAGFDPTQTAVTNRNLELADKNTLAAVQSGKDEQWERIKADATQNGITAEIYAKALNGDQESTRKFEEYVKGLWKRNPGSLGGRLPMSVALPGVLPDLGTGVENLYQTTAGIAVGQATRQNLEGNRRAGEDYTQRSKPATLSPAGQAKFPGATDINRQPDGSIGFVVDRLTREQAQALEEGDPNTPGSGARLTPLADNGDGTSRYSVVIPGTSPFAGYAKGGSVWGAGSATSDSIPALLSNGEFVINAKSASIIGHDNLAALNSIQAFAPGGPVKPVDPSKSGSATIKLSGPAKQTAKVGGWGAGPAAPPKPMAPSKPGPLDPKLKPDKSGWVLPGKFVESPNRRNNLGEPMKDWVPYPMSVSGRFGGQGSPATPAPKTPVTPSTRSPWFGEKRGRFGSFAVPTPSRGPAAPPKPEDRSKPRALTLGQLAEAANAQGSAVVTKPSEGRVPNPTPIYTGPKTADTGGGVHPSTAFVGNLVKYIFPDVWLGNDYRPLKADPYANREHATGEAGDFITEAAVGLRTEEGLKRGDILNSWMIDNAEMLGLQYTIWRGMLYAPGRDPVPNPGLGITQNHEDHIHYRVNPGKNAVLQRLGLDEYLKNLKGLPSSTPQSPPAPQKGSPNDPQAWEDLSDIPTAPPANPPANKPPVSPPAPAPAPAPAGGTPPPDVVAAPAPSGPATVPPAVAGPAAEVPPVPPGVPGINAPIPGPFGPIPLEPFDLLKTIGMEILKAIFGFFGIDISGIISMFNGFGFGKPQAPAPGVPNLNVDPGPDPEVIRQLNEMADQADAAGDYAMAREYRELAQDYAARVPPTAPGQPDPYTHSGSGARPGPAMAAGGYIRGPGTATSDSIPAMLSDGEYVIRAAAVKRLGVDQLNMLNSIDKYAKGGPIPLRKFNTGGPASIDPRLPITPPPPPPPPPSGSSDPDAFKALPPITEEAAKKVESLAGAGGQALSSVLAPKGGGSGGSARAGQPTPKDPRSILAQASPSGSHNNPALSGVIKGAAGTIGALAGTAAAAGLSAVNGVAPGAGSAAGGAAAQIISAGAQMVGQVADGAVNILSSLLVGTATPSETGQGYGAPMLAPEAPKPTPNFQSIHNGDIVTNNLTEYQRLRDRRDAQRSAPFFNRMGS